MWTYAGFPCKLCCIKVQLAKHGSEWSECVYLGIGWEVGTTGTNLGQLASCSCTLEQEAMWDLILTRVTWKQTHTHKPTSRHLWFYIVGNEWLVSTFLLQPLHGALYKASCFSTLEERSTFLGSKGTRHRGQSGEVTWRHGCRHSPQNLGHQTANSRGVKGLVAQRIHCYGNGELASTAHSISHLKFTPTFSMRCSF